MSRMLMNTIGSFLNRTRAAAAVVIVLLVVTQSASGSGTGSAITITTADGNGADTYVSDDNPDVNYGSAEEVVVQLAGSDDRDSYIRFDTSALADVPIYRRTRATLKFYVHTLGANRTNTLGIYGVTDGMAGEGFDETTLTWTIARDGSPDYLPRAGNVFLGGVEIVHPDDEGTIVEFSTPELLDFINADTNNMIVFHNYRIVNGRVLYASKENTSGYTFPTLEVEVIPEPATLALLGLGALFLMKRRSIRMVVGTGRPRDKNKDPLVMPSFRAGKVAKNKGVEEEQSSKQKGKPEMTAVRKLEMRLVVALIAMVSVNIVHAAEDERELEVFVSPNLPVEGEEVAVTVCFENGQDDWSFDLNISNSEGDSVLARTFKLADGRGVTTWKPAKNGIYRITVTGGGVDGVSQVQPVLSKGRKIDFVWHGYRPHLRWATVFTAGPRGEGAEKHMERMRVRGIKQLRWTGATGHPKDWTHERMFARALAHYRKPKDFIFDGWGIDEFGGYPTTEQAEYTVTYLRALAAMRRSRWNPKGDKVSPEFRLPDDFYIAAWHAGGVRDEMAGAYKQAVDLLLLEGYVTYFLPRAMSTENILEKLRNRLIAIRQADMFVPTGGSRCKTLIGLDITSEEKEIPADLGEIEEIIRFIRRIAPEMRGMAFFSHGTPEVEQAVEELCFEYFILPTITLQENSVWLDRQNDIPKLVAMISNIGAMDSGSVRVQFRVNDKVVGEKKAETVPAGFSRLTNRRKLEVDWRPEASGVQVIQARIISASGATILDPVYSMSRFVDVDTK